MERIPEVTHVNKTALAPLFILFVLLVSAVGAASAADDAAPVKIVLDKAHGTAHEGELEGLPAKLEAWGYTVVVVEDAITSSALAGAKILLVPVPMGADFTDAERAAIVAWFDAGDVAIWVAGDSDFDGPEYIPYLNTLLEELGSSIFFENASVEEPGEAYNDGSAYRVVASAWNSAHPIAEGVSKETFHGPTFIYAEKSGSPVNLATTSVSNVSWIAKSSDESVVVSPWLSPLMTPGIETGSKGPFVLMAVQENAGKDSSSKIVLTVEATFSAYKNMNMDGPSEKAIHDIQGETLLKNTLAWMEAESEGSSNTMLYAGIAVVVIVLIAAAAFTMRKK
ncbi:MAG: hypothetical protein PHW58_02385 [Candidatus Methanofastidiosa archaeon]|nr:hypothetical protein [Candidatus Methanofastidiosa archaeon]